MNPAVLTYEYWLSTQYEAVRDAMMRGVANSTAGTWPILLACAAIVALTTFFSWSRGHITWGKAFVTLLRVLFVAVLIGTQNLYTSRVAMFVFETVPNEIASKISGSPVTVASYRQFDNIRMQQINLTADVRRKNTDWSLAALGNAMTNQGVDAAGQFWLTIIAYVWLTSIRLMAVVLCIGPWLMLFELWDRTRGFFQSWLGVVVGLLTFQVAASTFLQISTQSQMQVLRTVHAANRGSNNIDVMLQNLQHVANAVFGDAMTMLALPAICGGSAALAAGMAARFLPSQMQRAYDRARGGSRAARA